MKFNCSREQLMQAINLAQRGVANKSTISVLQGILFQAEDDQLFLTPPTMRSPSAPPSRQRSLNPGSW